MELWLNAKDLPYQTGERTGMQKIKKQRTADCVVGGFRYLEKKPLVGSLLLGLYNEEGVLDHVGFSSSIQAEERLALTKKLESMIKPPGFTGKAPGRGEPLEHQAFDGVAAAGPEVWWRKCSSTTLPAGGFATARSFCAGVRKKRRGIAQ